MFGTKRLSHYRDTCWVSETSQEPVSRPRFDPSTSRNTDLPGMFIPTALPSTSKVPNTLSNSLLKVSVSAQSLRWPGFSPGLVFIRPGLMALSWVYTVCSRVAEINGYKVGCWLGDRETGVRLPAGAKHFLMSSAFRFGPGSAQPSMQWVAVGPCSGVMWKSSVSCEVKWVCCSTTTHSCHSQRGV